MAMCCYYHLRLINRLLPIMTQSTHCNQMVTHSPPSLRIELAKSPKAWKAKSEKTPQSGLPGGWFASPSSIFEKRIGGGGKRGNRDNRKGGEQNSTNAGVRHGKWEEDDRLREFANALNALEEVRDSWNCPKARRATTRCPGGLSLSHAA